ALGAVAFATFLLPLGWSAPLAVVAVLAIGVASGVGSGALVARYRLQPFIATLAMMVFARGLAKHVAGGRKVTTYLADGRSVELPPIFSAIDSRVIGDNVSIVTLVFLACVALTWVILERLRVGRHILAV